MLFRGRQQIVTCIVAVVLVTAFVVFRYLPLRQRVKVAEQKLAAQKLAIAKGLAEAQRVPESKEQLAELRKTIGNYEQRIPDNRALGEFLHGMANLMNEYNLTEQLIEPGAETEAGQLNGIPVKMKCKGRLKQIFGFYERLKGLDRLVRIEQIELANDRDLSGEVAMETNAVIYYRPEKAKS